MDAPLDYMGTWQKRRYHWKKELTRCQHLSRGAKWLASILCDNYANYKTACCYPSNDTLAGLMNLSVRTVQRDLEELKRGQWTKQVRLKNRRRSLQLVFPPYVKDDSEHDTRHRYGMTPMTRKPDTGVAPYREPKKNLKRAPREARRRISCITVGAQENQSLENWRQWVSRHMGRDPEDVLNSVRSNAGYLLPCRFPGDKPDDVDAYLDYFQSMISTSSSGTCSE